MIILRARQVRNLHGMGVGWVRDGCDVQARVVLCGCGAGDDGAATARAARCGECRRIFCCHLADERGGTVGFPQKRNSARFTASNRLFSPVFLYFFALAPAGGLGARFAARSHRVTRASPLLSARISVAVITPTFACHTQNQIIYLCVLPDLAFSFCCASAFVCFYNA